MIGLIVSAVASFAFAFYWARKYRGLEQNIDAAVAEASDEAKKAVRTKETFLANISHETRTPMNAIIGLSHILLQSNLSDEQKSNLFKIKRSAEHLLSITNDILDYSKLEAGKLTLESIAIDSNNFFNNISDIITPTAVEKELDLIFDIAPDIPECWRGDPLRLSQILLNLLNNAVKFTQRGQVVLRVIPIEHEGTEALRFEVRDTGIGMTEEQLALLFKAFTQADSSISRTFGGTGLGLSISSELAAMMGSSIHVESRYGEGSVFSFVFPLRRDTKPEEKHDRLSKRLMEGKSILIADQSGTNAKVLASVVSHLHAHPKIAETPKQLLRLLEWERYDALCIDSRMIAEVDKAFLKKHCDAVVVLLYDILPGSAAKLLAPDAVLQKPFTPLTVQSSMTEIFGKTIVKNKVRKKHVGFEDILVLKGSRILLAEDNEGNVMVIEGLLEGSGIRLHSVPNGQKAVEAVMKTDVPYDLLLMDINMPVMDGFAATSILREYQKYDNLPIIAMTANITESDMNKTKSFGMQDFIGKPVDVEQFYTMLLKYIKTKAAPGDVMPLKIDRPDTEASPAPGTFTLPGVDTAEGLSRVNGNQEAYLKILKKYAELFADIPARLRKAVSEHAYDEGIAIAHNLKGLSGNIGAMEIYELASVIEAGFRTGERVIDKRIDMLAEKLHPLLHAIETHIRENVREQTAKETITPASLSGMLESLRESAVRKKALDIKQGCSALKTYRLPEEQHPLFEQLFASAEHYQYQQVIGHIDAILGGIH